MHCRHQKSLSFNISANFSKKCWRFLGYSKTMQTIFKNFIVISLFVCFKAQCQDLRKRKNLEIQILSEPVRGWEGDSMKSLGQVAYMSQVHVRSGSNEVRDGFELIPSETHRAKIHHLRVVYILKSYVFQHLCHSS